MVLVKQILGIKFMRTVDENENDAARSTLSKQERATWEVEKYLVRDPISSRTKVLLFAGKRS